MWFDKTAVEVMLKLRDGFSVRTLIETGTYLGVGTKFFAHYFERVISCDINDEYLSTARRRNKDMRNVTIIKGSSPEVIHNLRANKLLGEMPMFFLDAHWYAYWPILDELASLKDFPECIILIHDFKVDGFGYDTYDFALDLPYVRSNLKAINPDFKLYVNIRGETNIWTKEETRQIKGFDMDDPETIMLFDYAWVEESNRYRGCLYAVPMELRNYPLRKIEWNSD